MFTAIGAGRIRVEPREGPTLRIKPLNIPSTLREWSNSLAWQIEAAGGTPPYSFRVVAGTRIPGYVLQSDGKYLSQFITRPAAGSYSWVVQVRDANNGSALATVNADVAYALLSGSWDAPPSAVIGQSYPGIGGYITLDGGDGTYTLELKAGTYLPAGLALEQVAGSTTQWDITGACTGVQGQVYSPIFTATSGDGQTKELAMTVSVQATAPPLVLIYAAFPQVANGAPYGPIAATVTNGTGTYTYIITQNGSALGTLTINASTGAITASAVSGTPGVTYTGTVTVTDTGTGRTATCPYAIPVLAAPATIALTMPTFTAATVGAAYSKDATVTGYTGALTWVISGTLPPNVSGAAVAPDKFRFLAGAGGVGASGSGQTYSGSLQVTDAGTGDVDIQSWSINVPAIAQTPLTASIPALANFTVGMAYGPVAFAISGGTAPYEISRAGPVPTGITSTVTNAFQGTPSDGAGQTFPGGFAVTDSSVPPQSVEIPYSLIGNPAVGTGLTVTMPTFTDGVPLASYSKSVTTSGATGQLFASITGTLPPGITVTPDNLTAATSWTFAGTFAASAAGKTYAGTIRVFDDVTLLTTVKSWQIIVGAAVAVFVAPRQTALLPNKTFTGGTAGSQTYNTADYVDEGDATDLVVGIDVTGATPFPAGVSATMNSTGIGGTFTLVSTGILNPDADLTTDYRLSMTYTDPTTAPPISDNEADWIARSTGAGTSGMRVCDFREFASTAALLAASVVGSNQNGNSYVPGTYLVELDKTDGITGGGCLKITTFDTAGQQGGGFGLPYRIDGQAVNDFYFQFAIKLNEAALFWESLHDSGSGRADTKKIMNMEAYGTGQVSVLAGTHGFPTIMVDGSPGLKRTISSGTGYGGDVFRHTAIDNGTTVVSGNKESYAQRYGLSEGLTTAIAGRYAPGTMTNQQGYEVPEPNAIIGGSVPYPVDDWLVIEAKVKNDSANNANDIIKMWAARYGQAPKLLVDNEPGGAGTISGSTIGNPQGFTPYRRWEALNYPTHRAAEAGRPVQVQKYDQFIPSLNWIPFPGYLTGTEP